MKYKIVLFLLCVFFVLSGCKVELPSQRTGSAAASPAISESASSSADSVSPPSSAPESTASGKPSSAPLPVSSAAASGPSSASSGAAKSAIPASRPAVSAAPEKEQSCALTVTATDILAHRERFDAEQLSAVPKDGILLSEDSLAVRSGDTVFDVLLRAAKAKDIAVGHTSVLQSAYVQSIAGIAEKDFGPLSGWTYTVNGKQPPVACSSYRLKGGEQIQWIFVCGDSK